MATNKVFEGTPWGITFDVNSPISLDSRFKCNSVADMISLTRWNEGTTDNPSYSVYPGMPTVVTNNGKETMYIYQGVKNSSVDIQDINKWERIPGWTDIKDKVSGAVVYKGSENYLSVVKAKTNPTIGDMWNVKYKGTSGTTAYGMNYACYDRYAQFKTEVHDGDTVSGYNTSGGSISGIVLFEDGYAYLKVTNGASTILYAYSDSDDVFVSLVDFPTTPKNPILGKWDEMGASMQDVPTKTELTSGTLKVAISTSADGLTTKRSIDGVQFDGTSDITRYNTCTTEANVQNKETTITGFSLTSGAEVKIKFTHANTEESPKLKVKSSDSDTSAEAKDIKLGSSVFKDIQADIVYSFVYDGTSWQISGGGGNGLSDNQKAILNQFADPGTNATYDDVDLAYCTNTTQQNNRKLMSLIINDYKTQRNKLKFLKFDQTKCKYDVDELGTSDKWVVVSFIYKGRLVRVKLYEQDTASNVHVEFLANGIDLAEIYTVSTVVYADHANVQTLMDRTTWYTLD